MEKLVRQIDAIYERGKQVPEVIANFYVIPLNKLHSSPSLSGTPVNSYVDLFAAVALVIVMLALVNYLSIATMHVARRTKEIGVRKVFGASRIAIGFQFYVESLVFVAASFIFGFLLFLMLGRMVLNSLDLNIDAQFMRQPAFLFFVALLFLVVSGLSGLIPAAIFSRYNPVDSLKLATRSAKTGSVLRTFLIVFQFCTSSALVMFSIIIGRQLYFLENRDIGLNRDNVIMVPFNESNAQQFITFRAKAKDLPQVEQVSVGQHAVFGDYETFSVSNLSGGTFVSVPSLVVDSNFLTTLHIKLKVRRGAYPFSRGAFPVVINETALSLLGFHSDSIGEGLNVMGNTSFQVAGIVDDFLYNGSVALDKPLLLIISNDSLGGPGAEKSGCFFLKLSPTAKLNSTVGSIKKLFSSVFPNGPFNFKFLDEAFLHEYLKEQRLLRLLKLFTFIAISIAFIGLFGLSAFIAERRRKEIGIRKVLGASLLTSIVLLVRQVLFLIVISLAIATPLAWYMGSVWLMSFTARANITPLIFVVPAIITLVVSILTVLFIVLKTALDSPIYTLKEA